MEDSPTIDILVIEDDADARENLCDILELDHHRVKLAASAAEALARTDLANFSAIILDRRLPDAMAEQLMPCIKERAPDCAVIVVTGYADLQGAIAALRQGATDYILKPLNPDALRNSLARIAERRRLALDKERSEAAFRHLVEVAECLIVIVRTDHSIVYFSPFAEQVTGYTAGEIRGRDYLELLVPAPARSAAAREFLRIIAGHPTRGFESAVICRDGTFRTMVWNARYLTEYEGSPAILEIGHDITSLKEAQERTLQAERLAAIGQVVTGLAHESRNALQRSQACLEMLALAVRDRPKALDLIERLQQAQDRLHTLYEDVRSYASPIKLEKVPTDICAVWRQAWSHLEATHKGEPFMLREVIEGANPHCLVDAFRLEQVFHNIFDNALAAGSKTVQIGASNGESELEGRPTVQIAVRDFGPGIGPDQRTKIFDPFFTTKAKGTGLGMAIAKRIVEAHGGRIAVGDCDGPGALFLITLPKGLK